jgi:threonine aldolase
VSFISDNTSSVHTEILEAMVEAGRCRSPSYGADVWTRNLTERLRETFECDLAVHPVITGTAANALALSALTPPWGTVICHRFSHIFAEECGATGYLGGGLLLTGLDGEHGKLTAPTVERWLERFPYSNPRHSPGATLSIAQATEAGTVYKLEELESLGALCEARGMTLHMDGARFANALVKLGCTPAQMTWKSGVTMLSFGATKNGAFAAEALIDFQPAHDRGLLYRRVRSGQLLSKLRVVSAQLLAYLNGGLWLELAARANESATQLASALEASPQTTVVHPVESNEVFVEISSHRIARILSDKYGLRAREWPRNQLFRLVTSHDTLESEIADFVTALDLQVKID